MGESERRRVLHAVTPYGRSGPSSRVRVHEWLDRSGVPTVVSGYLWHRNSSPRHLARRPGAVFRAERRLRRMALSYPERLLLHREASPLSRGELEQRLLRSADFAIYDFDDALQWDSGEGGILRRLAPKAPKALAAVEAADRVIAGNAVLAQWASEHNGDVVLIPSCVAHDRYRPKADYQVSDPPRLGWIGSPDNETYLRLLAPALDEVHRRTGARVTLIGTVRPALGELERMIDRVPWSEESQHELLAELDVGLAPLPDEPYTRGKCGYRLLQYGAAGVPMVASPVGVNRDLLARFGMPAAESLGEWSEAILGLLAQTEGERELAGRRAFSTIERDYSYDAWLPRWLDAVGMGLEPR